MSRVSAAANLSRSKSRASRRNHPHVMEADLAVRTEWVKLSQSQRGLPLTAIIQIVAHRRAIWHMVSESAKSTANNPKGGKRNDGIGDLLMHMVGATQSNTKIYRLVTMVEFLGHARNPPSVHIAGIIKGYVTRPFCDIPNVNVEALCR